jgi:hypothetical protein
MCGLSSGVIWYPLPRLAAILSFVYTVPSMPLGCGVGIVEATVVVTNYFPALRSSRLITYLGTV